MATNPEPTAKLIEEIAADFRLRAEALEAQAAELRETGDLNIASMALSTATNTSNLRLDLLVTKPLREMQRENAQQRS